MKKIVILLITLMAWLSPRLAAGAVLPVDGFNIYSSGSVRITGTGIRAIAVQPWDGKVVIGGDFTATGSGVTVKNLARLKNDGTLDTAFAPAPDATVRAIAVVPDRSAIYVGGDFGTLGTDTYHGLARLNEDGSAVQSFTPSSQGGAVVNAILLVPGGIVVGGRFTQMDNAARGNLARISSAGAVTAAFPAGTDAEVFALALQEDGKVLAGGSFLLPQAKLARFDANGAHDAAFAATASHAVRALALQADGKILAGGDFTSIAGGNRGYLARLTPDGTLDAFNADADRFVAALAVQPDGAILVGGDFTVIGGVARNRAARLKLTGAVESDPNPHLDINPNLDAAVYAIVVQPDDSFLIGGDFSKVAGGAKPRTRLARYYRGGALDEDVTIGPAIWSNLNQAKPIAIANQPDGRWYVFGGFFISISGVSRVRMAGLYTDWTLAPKPDESLPLSSPLVVAPNPDGTFVVGGYGLMNIHGLDANGDPDATFQLPEPYLSATTRSLIHLRRGTRLPDGTLLPDDMMYIGTEADPTIMRISKNGTPDPTFIPPPVLSAANSYAVTSIALMPDNKILVGTWNGLILRLKTDGSIDPDFTPIVTTLTSEGVNHIVVEPDGEHARAYGVFRNVFGGNQMIRFDSRGVIDASFVHTVQIPGGGFTPQIEQVVPYTDGSMVLTGRFLKIDGVDRDSVARILPDGRVDPDLDLGTIVASTMVDKVVLIKSREDGKFMIGGLFTKINGNNTKQHLVRFANGFATQELSVSPLGDTVTWKRGGRSPELWRVVFQDSDDGVTWNYLGEGVRTQARDGWYLGGQSLGGAGRWNTNRWVRAYGYLAGDRWGDATILTSVRLYYLKPPAATVPITVKVLTDSRKYGDANPAFTDHFTVIPALNNGDVISRVQVTSTAPADAKAGESHPLTGVGVVFSSGPAANYQITYEPGTLSITQRPAAVAPNSTGKFYGENDPAFTGTLSGFLPGDGVSAVYARDPGTRVGVYEIHATLSPAAVLGNYSITPVPGFLTINPLAASVDPDPASKKYGKADPATLTGNLQGFLAADGVSAVYRRDPGEEVSGSPYAIRATLSPAAVLGNYAVTMNTANFTIEKGPLTVRADDKSKVLGLPLPGLTASYDGLAPWDTRDALGGTPDLTTDADLNSPLGSYTIFVTKGTISSGNYDYTFQNGTLTVTGPRAQTITFELPAKTFGDGDFDPGATSSSHLPVSYRSAQGRVATVVGGKIRVVAAGTEEITAYQLGDAEYKAADDVTLPLLVHPPPWHGLSFDGVDDVMQVPDIAPLDFGAKSGYTVETWLKLDGGQPDGTALVSKGGGGDGWRGYQLMLHRNRIAAALSDGASSFGVAQGLVGTSALNDGQWHHVALSVDRDHGRATLYLDGRSEADLANPILGLDPSNALPLLAGVDRDGTRFFRGKMDELRVWDTARSRDQIRSAGSQIVDPLVEPHLVGYFHLDEGEAGKDNASCLKAPERTANGNDATLTGFALNGATSNWVASGAFLPLLETYQATLAGSDIDGGGLVYPNYYPATEVGLCWGDRPNPSLSGSCVRGAKGGGGAFSGRIVQPLPGFTYHVRAYAKNAMGTAYGNEVTVTVPGGKRDQTITFELPGKVYGDPDFAPGATASSGLPVGYRIEDPAVAVFSDGAIRITGAGSTRVTASQGGDSRFNPAPDVVRTLTVEKAPLRVSADHKTRAYRTANPPLTFSLSGFVKGENASVVTGLPLLATAAAFESPVGDYPITVAIGTLAAANYRFVAVNGTLSIVGSCDDDIVFPPLGERTYGDPPTEIVAYTCSALGIAFASSDLQVVRVDGNVMTITGAGSALITASHPGAATGVGRPLLVHRSWQGVSFPQPAQKALGDPPFALAAAASSGLPVRYRSSDPAVAVVEGNTATLVGPGTAVITASQEGDRNFEAALPASRPLTVSGEGEAPLLVLSALSSGAVSPTAVLNVTGSASDPSGIASLTVDGIDLTQQAALFSSAVPLRPGENRIVVSARDGAGNRSMREIAVSFDAAAPLLSVAQPPDNSVTDAPLFAARGAVAPGSTVTFGVNGEAPQPLEVVDGGFSGSGRLKEGLNTIEFSARLAGRSSSVKRSVTLAPGKPPVAIREPAQDLRTERETVTLRGVAGAPGSGVSLLLEVEGNSLALKGGEFEQQVALPRLGENRITATASDASGNTSVARRNVVRVEKVTGDLNGDGAVDIGDAVAALRISLGMDPATAQALAHGDLAPLVDGEPRPDGVIDVGDVLVLLRKIVGLADF